MRDPWVPTANGGRSLQFATLLRHIVGRSGSDNRTSVSAMQTLHRRVVSVSSRLFPPSLLIHSSIFTFQILTRDEAGYFVVRVLLHVHVSTRLRLNTRSARVSIPGSQLSALSSQRLFVFGTRLDGSIKHDLRWIVYLPSLCCICWLAGILICGMVCSFSLFPLPIYPPRVGK